jgi:F-type H+-transporting ATPase subunit b
MEIIQRFGLEVKLFLFQLINFLIMVFILKRFLYAPFKKILDERKNKIEQSLNDIESAKIVLENANLEKKKILAEAKNNASKLTKSVEISTEETRKKSVLEAKIRSEEIVNDAKRKAVMEFEIMSKQVGNMSIDISGRIVSKILSNLFTGDEKKKLIELALKKIDEKITN